MARWTIAQKLRCVSGAMWFAPLLVAALVLLLFSRTFPLWPMIAAVSAAIPLLAGLWWQYRTRRRLQQLREIELSGCLYCLQDLRGIGMRGTCPECGQAFDLYATRESWNAAIGDLLPTEARDREV